LARRLVAEAIGLAVIDGVDRAVGLDVFAERKAHHALTAELPFSCEGSVPADGKQQAADNSVAKQSPHPAFLVIGDLVGAQGLQPWTRRLRVSNRAISPGSCR